MFIQLEMAERDLLIELVERRLTALDRGVADRHRGARDTMVAVAAEREMLEDLLCQLRETQWDVTA